MTVYETGSCAAGPADNHSVGFSHPPACNAPSLQYSLGQVTYSVSFSRIARVFIMLYVSKVSLVALFWTSLLESFPWSRGQGSQFGTVEDSCMCKLRRRYLGMISVHISALGIEPAQRPGRPRLTRNQFHVLAPPSFQASFSPRFLAFFSYHHHAAALKFSL